MSRQEALELGLKCLQSEKLHIEMLVSGNIGREELRRFGKETLIKKIEEVRSTSKTATVSGGSKVST